MPRTRRDTAPAPPRRSPLTQMPEIYKTERTAINQSNQPK